jgi:competence protein ComEC
MRIKKSNLTIFFLLAFLVGTALANFFQLPIYFLAGGILFGILLAGFGRKLATVLLLSLVLAGVSSGFLRFQSSIHEPTEGSVDFYNDQEERVDLVGVIVEEPDRRADHAKYILEVSHLGAQEVEGRVLVKLGKLPKYLYGDELKVSGMLKAPFETEEFSYGDYLKLFQVYSVMYYPRAWKNSEGNASFLFEKLFAFKEKFEGKINQIFPEPQASFEAGLLIGSRRGIPPKVLEDFNTTGLTHIIAISGYNISLVIAFMTALFGSYVSRRWQFPLAAILVAAFTLAVGANAAVVRAAIMGLLAFYALTHGRQYHVGLALILTAAVMTFWNPRVLMSDVSFQLSFAAVAGLLFVSPLLEKWAEWIPNKFAIRESLLLTMSAQVTAVPLIVFYFERLSLIAPIANLLVAPAIPLAMLIGFVSTIFGAVFLPAGVLVGFLAHGLLSYILWVAKWSAKLPLASVDVGWFGIGLVVLYYVGLMGFLLWRQNSSLKKKR